MPLVVHKYGGSSVATPERIRAVARRVVKARERGSEVVVVVSAMGDTTDALHGLAARVTGKADVVRAHPREMDMLLTAGERISMALLAMAIREAGADAVSFTGSQAAIITDEAHTSARILEVRADRLRDELAHHRIVIVAGFQGVSRAREVTTLGRGGSDTTAVALAAALQADECRIYTDVDGVFTADPRSVPDARRISEISYAEMIELASAGAQVMHPRAVEIAARFGVEVRVLSSLGNPDFADSESGGTRITQRVTGMEELALTGITSASDQAKLVLRGLPAGLRTTTELLVRLADAGVSVDMISESRDHDGRAVFQVTVAQDAITDATAIGRELIDRSGGEGVETVENLTRIALVGSGMHGRPGVYARAFEALLAADIDVQAVSTSAISITLLVPTDRAAEALPLLHSTFELQRRDEVDARSDSPAGG